MFLTQSQVNYLHLCACTINKCLTDHVMQDLFHSNISWYLNNQRLQNFRNGII